MHRKKSDFSIWISHRYFFEALSNLEFYSVFVALKYVWFSRWVFNLSLSKDFCARLVFILLSSGSQ